MSRRPPQGHQQPGNQAQSGQPPSRPSKKGSNKILGAAVVIIAALITAAGTIIAAKIQSDGNRHDQTTTPTTIAVLSSSPTQTPVIRATLNAQATQTAVVQAYVTATAEVQTPMHTLQTLCTAALHGDYQTQWNQFDLKYAQDNWHNESEYASDLKNRDTSHNGVANCTVSNVRQNGSSASGITTTTFGDSTTDTILFSLIREAGGVWRINGLQHV